MNDLDRLCDDIRQRVEALKTLPCDQLPRKTLIDMARDLQTVRLHLERVLREGRVQ